VNDNATPSLNGTANLAAVKKAADSPKIFALSTSTVKSNHCPDSIDTS
jgi:hypothetical protein